jgi:hypothetical protein
MIWRRSRRLSCAALVVIALSPQAFAINGTGAVGLAPDNGWRAFEIVSQGNNIAGISDAGYGATFSRTLFDGLGTILSGNKLSINVNHETADAAISRVDVSVSALRQAVQSRLDSGVTPFPSSFVTGIGYSYERIYDGTYHAISNPNPVAVGTPAIVNYGIANLDRFCSGSSYVPQAFGPGRGLLDYMYITGEEVTGGKFYAIDQATRSMWEVPALGPGSWENAAQVDTGNTTHVAMVLSSDINSPGSDFLRLYVGRKGIDTNGDGSVDFLERNGLRGGTVYVFTPDAGQSTTDLPDARQGNMTGKWTISTAGALREDKFEDVHTNPLNGTQLVFADQTDGVYRLDTPLVFSGGTFLPASSPVTMMQIDDDDASAEHPFLGAPDNLYWSSNGKMYVQEDGDGYEIWQINQAGGGHLRIAQAATEPSGIIDASVELGYQLGSVLMSSLMGDGTTAQLVVLISPAAQPAYPHGDFNRDTVVDAADFVAWQKDPTYSAIDYTVWRQHFGASVSANGTGGEQIGVPEPQGWHLLAAAAMWLARGTRERVAGANVGGRRPSR